MVFLGMWFGLYHVYVCKYSNDSRVATGQVGFHPSSSAPPSLPIYIKRETAIHSINKIVLTPAQLVANNIIHDPGHKPVVIAFRKLEV